jgi:glycosyltransferase involved in cell wall biosynthesis
VHAVVEVHDTLLKEPGAVASAGVGASWIVHSLPFQCSISATEPLSSPNARPDEDDDVVSFRGTLAYRDVSAVVWERRRSAIGRVLQTADLVTTPSEELAERFRERGAARVSVIENHVPGTFLGTRPQPHAGVTIGWVAAAEHLYDAEQLRIRDALQRILDARPEVRVVSVGIPLKLDSDRYRHVPPVPLVQLGAGVTHGGDPRGTTVTRMEPGLARQIAEFDVAIAPLAAAPFNVTRSNIKLKEYAAVGVPWLASPIGPYEAMGEREGGRLVADDDWHDAILRLVDKPRERRKLAKRALKWVEGQTIEQHAGAWEAALTEAMERARERRRSAA